MSSFRILVADDLPVWRVGVRNLLRARPDWRILDACDGHDPVQKATEFHLDIVLLDVGMPILNGFEAARKIREATPSSKIIFVTVNGDDDLKTAALAMGAEHEGWLRGPEPFAAPSFIQGFHALTPQDQTTRPASVDGRAGCKDRLCLIESKQLRRVAEVSFSVFPAWC